MCIGAHSYSGLEFMIFMAGSMPASVHGTGVCGTGVHGIGMHGTGAVAESVYLDSQVLGRERGNWEWCELLKSQGPRLNDTPPSAKLCLPILTKQFHQLETKHSNIRAYGWSFSFGALFDVKTILTPQIRFFPHNFSQFSTH